MTDHAGNLISTGLASDWIVSDLRNYESSGFFSALLASSVDVSLSQWPEANEAIKELAAWDFLSDEKIYLIPLEIDAGLIGSDLDYTITVWNANDASITLTSVVQSNSDGFVLDMPVPPFDLTAETYYSYILTILKDGPPVQATEITFFFDNGDSKTITLSGKRMEVFPYELDASSSLAISFKHQTVIATSNKYVEQRRSLLQKPVISLEAGFWFELDKTQTFLFSLRAFADKILAVPVWAEEFKILADPVGLFIIELDDPDTELSNCYFFENARFLLLVNIEDSFDYELSEIFSINQGTGEITVSSNISKSFPILTTRVFPVITCFSPEITSAEHLTNEIVKYTLVFEEYR